MRHCCCFFFHLYRTSWQSQKQRLRFHKCWVVFTCSCLAVTCPRVFRRQYVSLALKLRVQIKAKLIQENHLLKYSKQLSLHVKLQNLCMHCIDCSSFFIFIALYRLNKKPLKRSAQISPWLRECFALDNSKNSV